jgi:nitroreductase
MFSWNVYLAHQHIFIFGLAGKNMELNEAIEKRASVREFSSKKVKWADVLEAVDAAINAPSAGGVSNLRFIIVDDQDVKNRISEFSQQSWVAKAGYIVVVCSDESKLEKMYLKRGLIYSRQQAGAAIENFLLRITDLGLGACWIGAYSDEIIKQALKIPENIHIEAIIPIGYPLRKPKKSRKPALENVINWNAWGVNKKPTRFGGIGI